MSDASFHPDKSAFGPRELRLAFWCVLLAIPAYVLGRCLVDLIAFFNNLFFHARFSITEVEGSDHLPLWAALIPALGGLLVGMIARYGSPTVRGHGIPEVIETVLAKGSRVPLRTALLKPLCAAISIGSGGPFGVEGPAIGLGASLGSQLGQRFDASDWEREVLLAAGAAAGVTAVFGCPIGATLLAVELLLFGYVPAAVLPVGLACGASFALRVFFHGSGPMWVLPALAAPGAGAWAFYALLGLPFGLAAAGIIRLVHFTEGLYERLPLHWMWWPAVGGLVVGAIALAEPRILGPSYSSIGEALDGRLAGAALGLFVGFKLLAWVLALGSGTTGSTLAPLFAIGAGLGALLTTGAALLWPSLGLDPRLGALLGLAAVFGGASHAVLASILIALETTHQAAGALPVLTCGLIAALVCRALLPHSLMTYGPASRGVKPPDARGRRKRRT
jgi:CIC family chloride channel protein